MTGSYIKFVPNRKGFDVVTAEGKRGRIEKRRGGCRFVMTRNVSNAELRAIIGFVGELNEA